MTHAYCSDRLQNRALWRGGQHLHMRAHLNSVFLKQISRAQSDHRTDRRWRCAANADHGNIAAMTAGSSVVLHCTQVAAVSVESAARHGAWWACAQAMHVPVVEHFGLMSCACTRRMHVHFLGPHLVWLDTVMRPCPVGRSSTTLWNASSPVMDVLLSTRRYSFDTAAMAPSVPTRPISPQGGLVASLKSDAAGLGGAAATLTPLPLPLSLPPPLPLPLQCAAVGMLPNAAAVRATICRSDELDTLQALVTDG